MDLDKLMGKHLIRYSGGTGTIPQEALAGKERLAANFGERSQDDAEKILSSSSTISATTPADRLEGHLEAVFEKEWADGRLRDPAKPVLRGSMTRDFLSLRTYGFA